MAKFDISNSRYAKFWDPKEGPYLLQTILSSDLIRANHTFFSSQFSIDPAITPRDVNGTAAFSSMQKEIQPSHMMDWRAPLGDTKPEERGNVAFYTATIPDFSAPGFVEQAMEREYKNQMLEEYFGNDANIVDEYVDKLQSRIDSADQTLSNMSAQLLSTGEITYNHGRGIQGGVYKVPIPADNFVKAGEAVWSATTTKILSQMVKIQNKFMDKWGETIAMKWQIPYDMFVNVFLPNEQVIEWVRYMRTVNNTPLPESVVLTQELVMQYLPSYPGLFPVEVVSEKQNDWTGTVQGWKQNAAVLRPQGYAGVIKHAPILDQQIYEKYGTNAISRVFAKSGNGLYTLMNTTLQNGNLLEWHSDLFMAAVPALEEFLYHVIVDTATADD